MSSSVVPSRARAESHGVKEFPRQWFRHTHESQSHGVKEFPRRWFRSPPWILLLFREKIPGPVVPPPPRGLNVLLSPADGAHANAAVVPRVEPHGATPAATHVL